MKNKFLLFMLLLVFIMPWAADGQTVTLVDGNYAHNSAPIANWYNYSLCEMIFTADEIGETDVNTIISLGFHSTNATCSKTYGITIYMKNVDAGSFTSATDYIQVSADDIVYTGSIKPETYCWNTIYLDTPFTYDHTKNLLVVVNKTSGSNDGNINIWSYNPTSSPYKMLYGQRDGSSYDPTTLTSLSPDSELPSVQLTFGAPITCARPTLEDVLPETIETNQASLRWVENGSATNWVLEYSTSNDFTNATSITQSGIPIKVLHDLNPGTTYYVRVKSDCGGGDQSFWSNIVSFTTVFSIPFIEEFPTESIPTCWARYKGLLENVMGGTATLESINGYWVFGPGNNVFDSHARINNYNTGHYYWLVTPQVAIENNVQLEFNLALTKYSGDNQQVTAGLQEDDKFIVLITRDGGTTWEILRQWDNAGSEYVYDNIAYQSNGQTITINLSSYAGQNIAIAFYAESTVATSGSDNNLHIDNVSIDYIPSCSKPTDLAANASTNSAELSWTANSGETAWTVYYKKTTDETYTEVTNASNPYTLYGLTAATNYQYYVVANCSANDASEPSVVFPFTTECVVVAALGYSENFDSYTAGNNVLPLCWNYINTTTSSSYAVFPRINSSNNNSSPNCLYLFSYYSSSSNYDPQPQYAILPQMENLAGKQISLWARGYNASSTFKIGTMTDPTNANTFVEIDEQGLTTSYKKYSYIIPETCTAEYVAIMVDAANSSRTTNGVYIDDIVINDAPSCLPPTHLYVYALYTTSATMTWDPVPVGEEHVWEVCVYPTANIPDMLEYTVTFNANTYSTTHLGDLQPNTDYTFFIRRKCSDDDNSEIASVSFTTLCETVTTFPWTEDFNSLTAGIPECWDNSEGTTTNASYKWNYYATGYNGAGVRFNSYNNTAGYTNFLKTPTLNFPANTIMQLRFWYKNPTGGDFSVYISTDGGSTYNTALATGLTGQNDWVEKKIFLMDYAGAQNVVIVFKGTSNYGNGDAYIYLDDVTVEEAPSCLPPTNLSVTNLYTTSATMRWDPVQGEHIWQVCVYPTANIPEVLEYTETNNANTYNTSRLYDLEPGTDYTFFIRRKCSDEDVSETVSVSFTTLCEAIDLSNEDYSENFDSYNGTSSGNINNLPDCWHYINGTTNNYYAGYPVVFYNIASSNSGSNQLRFTSINYDGNYATYDPKDQYAILPPMVNLAGKQITLWGRRGYANSTFKVGLMTNPFDASTFMEISNAANPAISSSYQKFTYIIPDDATARYVAIMMEAADATVTSKSIFIDDITISDVPACPAPTNLAVDVVFKKAADVSWTVVGDATDWEIQVSTDAGFEDPLTVYTTGGPQDDGRLHVNIGSLTPETTYYIRVRANCDGGDSSDWSETISFTTTVACPAPTEFTVTLVSNTEVDVQWKENGTATNWEIQYSTNTGFENPVTLYTETENPPVNGYVDANISSLTPEVIYYARVKAVCGGEDGESAWSNTILLEPTEKHVIGTAQNVNNYLPTYILYNYSMTQQIYTAAELGGAGIIESIDFYSNLTANEVRSIDIYMVHTNKSSFDGSTDWITVTADDLVCTKEVTFTSGWYTFDLDNPFVYDGVSNVAIIVDDNAGQWEQAIAFNTFNATSQAIYIYNDDTNYDPTDPSSYTGTVLNVKNQIRIMTATCLKPRDLAVDLVYKKAADVSWTVVGDATDWEIQVSTDAWFEDPLTVYTAGDPNDDGRFFANIGSLTPETTYYIRVRANCGGDDGNSAWSNVVSFTTETACYAPTELTVSDITPISAKIIWTSENDNFEMHYREMTDPNNDFDNSSLKNWKSIDADGDGYGWVIATASAGVYHSDNVTNLSGGGHNNSYDYVISGSFTNAVGANGTPLTPDNYLVSPQINLGGSISFWANAQDADYPEEHFGVAISTTGSEASDFTTIQEWTLTAKGTGAKANPGGNREQGAWYQYTVDLSAYSGRGYVAIRHFDCTDQFLLNVDDIVIVQPDYVEPEWIDVANVTNPYTLEGLDSEITYELEVRSNCGSEDGYSRWVYTWFSTPSACSRPTDLAVIDSTATTATLEWTGYASTYTLRYRTDISADIYFYDDFSTYELIDEEEGLYGLGDWTTVDIDEGDGNYGGVFAFWYTVNPPKYLISPELTLPEDETCTLQFLYAAYDAQYPESFKVGYSSTNTDLDSFTWSDEVTNITQTTGALYNEQIPAGTKYFAIQYTADDQYALLVTNFIIYGPITPAGEWVEVNDVTSPYTLTGLTPETSYNWQVKGGGCDDSNWSSLSDFVTTELTTVTQTIAIASGVSWVSFNVETDLEAVEDALVAALPGTNIRISSKDNFAYYNGTRWRGTLADLDLSQMYMIEATVAGEMTLEGMPADPAEHPVSIQSGVYWIGFPVSGNMAITDAFAGFALSGDKITSKDGYATYNGTRWRGTLTELVPGQGYIYESTTATSRVLVFPTNAKAMKK